MQSVIPKDFPKKFEIVISKRWLIQGKVNQKDAELRNFINECLNLGYSVTTHENDHAAMLGLIRYTFER